MINPINRFSPHENSELQQQEKERIQFSSPSVFFGGPGMLSRTSRASWDLFTMTSLSLTAVCILLTLEWSLKEKKTTQSSNSLNHCDQTEVHRYPSSRPDAQHVSEAFGRGAAGVRRSVLGRLLFGPGHLDATVVLGAAAHWPLPLSAVGVVLVV